MVNKNLLLIVFFVLIVFLSANFVFAGSPTNVTVSFSDGSFEKNVTLNQTLKINGNVKVASGANTVPSGDVVVYWWHNATQNWNLLNGSLANSKCVYSSKDGTFSYNLNMKSNFLPKGTSYLKVVFESSSPGFDSSQSKNLIINVFSNISIYVAQPKDAKVAVLQNYTVIVVDENGRTPVAGINVTYTDMQGKKVVKTTDAWGEAVFPIMLEKTIQHLLFTTPEMRVVNTYNWFLPARNNFTPYPVAKGDVNLTMAIDSPNGYILGDKAIITWNITGPLSLDNKFINIRMYSDGKLQNSYLVYASDGKSEYAWKKSHQKLDIVLIYPEDSNYIGAQTNITTFVDENKNFRSTQINVSGLTGLKVGKEGTLLFNVFDYMGNPVSSGKVSLKFDNFDPFTVDIIGGIANFTHTYQKAGIKRNLTITYLGEGINKDSTIYSQVNVAKGNALLSVSMVPNTTTVGVPSTITVLVNNLVIPNHKKIYAQINFIENGILQNSIMGPIISTGVNTGILQLDYTFIKSHPKLTILALMNETSDYFVTNSKFDTIINPGV